MSESQTSMARGRAAEFVGLQCTSESAQRDLANLGYTPEKWKKLLNKDGASHGFKATILIALGDPRTLSEIVEALSIEDLIEKQGLSPDNQIIYNEQVVDTESHTDFWQKYLTNTQDGFVKGIVFSNRTFAWAEVIGHRVIGKNIHPDLPPVLKTTLICSVGENPSLMIENFFEVSRMPHETEGYVTPLVAYFQRSMEGHNVDLRVRYADPQKTHYFG